MVVMRFWEVNREPSDHHLDEEKVMNPSEHPTGNQPRTISRWLAYVLFSIIWGVVPWALSLLTSRYGWVSGQPGVWNLLGLIPLAAGIAGSRWALGSHFSESHGRLDFEPDKSYLITSDLYAFSRNPMYLSELILLFGWVIFYGSIAVLISLLVWWALFSFVLVPQEERLIEARYGEAYHEYKRKVPRWFGKPQD
jgi:protein-S-isoprenylcysteine O-methyltransferase Ste14